MRYFLEVSYKGTNYSGFQVQENANSVQEEVEKAFATIQRNQVTLTCSSRTDTGVHALQNYFHFDYGADLHPDLIYKMNAILPPDITIKSIQAVATDAHCRFDAISREYKYFIYREKNPFLADRAYFYPYTLDRELLQQAAELVKRHKDFQSFSKRNSQVKTFICDIQKSEWQQEGDTLVYNVKANRFLRGMVRGLTATMLQVGRKKITLEQFEAIIASKDCTKADFSVPGHGLFLINVEYKGTG
jgi:tRNA pseudouridine38-40 synthase